MYGCQLSTLSLLGQGVLGTEGYRVREGAGDAPAGAAITPKATQKDFQVLATGAVPDSQLCSEGLPWLYERRKKNY